MCSDDKMAAEIAQGMMPDAVPEIWTGTRLLERDLTPLTDRAELWRVEADRATIPEIAAFACFKQSAVTVMLTCPVRSLASGLRNVWLISTRTRHQLPQHRNRVARATGRSRVHDAADDAMAGILADKRYLRVA